MIPVPPGSISLWCVVNTITCDTDLSKYLPELKKGVRFGHLSVFVGAGCSPSMACCGVAITMGGSPEPTPGQEALKMLLAAC